MQTFWLTWVCWNCPTVNGSVQFYDHKYSGIISQRFRDKSWKMSKLQRPYPDYARLASRRTSCPLVRISVYPVKLLFRYLHASVHPRWHISDVYTTRSGPLPFLLPLFLKYLFDGGRNTEAYKCHSTCDIEYLTFEMLHSTRRLRNNWMGATIKSI